MFIKKHKLNYTVNEISKYREKNKTVEISED